MTSPGWIPCSDASLERDDPLTGTAGYGERWFLVEIDGAWGQHAFFQSRLDPELGRALVKRIESAGMRPLAIRRTGRRTDARRDQKHWRWAVVDARAGSESVRWGSVDDPTELLDVPLDGSSGQPSDVPVICVCTHARHDQCCAVKGRPVVTALARLYPEETWECSHLGGDRFAATLVIFPEGLLYGRMTAADAPTIVEARAHGEVEAAWLRGRTSLTNVVQAAEAFARESTGDRRIDAFRLVGERRTGDGWTVDLAHDDEQLSIRLTSKPSESLLSTCAAVVAAPVQEFVRVS
jgi:hypothetical protein